MDNQCSNKKQGDRSKNRMFEFLSKITRQYQMLFQVHPEYFRSNGIEVEMECLSDNIFRGLSNRVKKYRKTTLNVREQLGLKIPQLVNNPDSWKTDPNALGLCSLTVPHEERSAENSIPLIVHQPVEGAAEHLAREVDFVRLPNGQNVPVMAEPQLGILALQYYLPVPPRLLPARIPNAAPQRLRHMPIPPRAIGPVMPPPPRMIRLPIAARIPVHPPQPEQPPRVVNPPNQNIFRQCETFHRVRIFPQPRYIYNSIPNLNMRPTIATRFARNNVYKNSSHFLRTRGTGRSVSHPPEEIIVNEMVQNRGTRGHFRQPTDFASFAPGTSYVVHTNSGAGPSYAITTHSAAGRSYAVNTCSGAGTSSGASTSYAVNTSSGAGTSYAPGTSYPVNTSSEAGTSSGASTSYAVNTSSEAGTSYAPGTSYAVRTSSAASTSYAVSTSSTVNTRSAATTSSLVSTNSLVNTSSAGSTNYAANTSSTANTSPVASTSFEIAATSSNT